MIPEISSTQRKADCNIDDKSYWMQIISSGISPAKINYDFKRLDILNCAEGCHEFSIEQETTHKILAITDGEPTLIFALLCANLNILLYKYSGNGQIIFGIPSLNETEHINIMPILTEIEEDTIISNFIQLAQSGLIETYKHQNLLFDDVLKEANHNSNENITSIYDIIISLDNIHPTFSEQRKNLTLVFKLQEGELLAFIFYKKDLYKHSSIEKLALWFNHLLIESLSDTNKPLKDLVMLDEYEIQTLVSNWGSGKETPFPLLCNHNAFENHVTKNPQRMAVSCGEKQLTYFQLNEAAESLASILLANGIATNDLVGIYTDRSIEMITSVLGVLKSGGAYVPFDPSYPTDRIKLMLDAVELKTIITQRKFAKLLNKLSKNISLIVVEDTLSNNIQKPAIKALNKENLAYVIFTSGSTGIPKCAGVCQNGWQNLLHWFTNEFSIGAEDKTLLISSFGFDITQRALMMPLISGAELHLYSRLVYDPAEIIDLIERHQITILNCTPSTFYPLVELNGNKLYEKLRSLRYLFLGGEPIAAGRLKQWAQSVKCNCTIVNVYGVTECSDVSSFYTLTDFDKYETTGVPIGTPIYNTKLFVLNENFDITPSGMEGELFIAGDGVGKGYVNDTSLTNQKFLQKSIAGEEVSIYRTGDLVKYRDDGVLTYSGRKDSQIKIRGHRIDLGEVESIINAQKNVKEAIVLVKDNMISGKELHCYFIPSNSHIDDAQVYSSDHKKGFMFELWESLRRILPNYMVPEYYSVLQEMPLTPNGKIDRSVLKNIPVDRVHVTKRVLELPTTEMEEYLLQLFKDLLNQTDISVTDDFFQAGGHSLTATQLVAQMNEKFNLNLRVTEIISRATVQKLGAHLESILH
jgi:amino acid adenylation domain-containing protein